MTTTFLYLAKFFYFLLMLISLLISWKVLVLFLLIQIFWRRSYKVRYYKPMNQSFETNNFIVSPVYGVIKEILIDQNRYVLKIEISLWGHKGFYAMKDSEVDSVDTYEHSQKTFSSKKLKKLMARPKYKAMQLIFNDEGFHFIFNVINTSLSLRPSTITMPGDRVKKGAHLGWIPTGGIVLIELPSSGKLMVKTHDHVKIFNTVLMEKM